MFNKIHEFLKKDFFNEEEYWKTKDFYSFLLSVPFFIFVIAAGLWLVKFIFMLLISLHLLLGLLFLSAILFLIGMLLMKEYW